MSEAFQRGDILSYADGPTALFQFVTESNHRIYGTHIMGGTHGAHRDNCRAAGKHDLETWINERGVTPSFDLMAKDFTETLGQIASWKHIYVGSVQRSRIRSALRDLKALIIRTELHPEVGPISNREIVEWLRANSTMLAGPGQEESHAVLQEVGMQLASVHNMVALMKRFRDHCPANAQSWEPDTGPGENHPLWQQVTSALDAFGE